MLFGLPTTTPTQRSKSCGTPPHSLHSSLPQPHHPLYCCRRRLRCPHPLPQAGGLPNAKGAHGNTALHLAAAGGHTGCIKALLDSRATADVHAADGCTPLHRAAAHGGCPERLGWRVSKSSAVEGSMLWNGSCQKA